MARTTGTADTAGGAGKARGRTRLFYSLAVGLFVVAAAVGLVLTSRPVNLPPPPDIGFSGPGQGGGSGQADLGQMWGEPADALRLDGIAAQPGEAVLEATFRLAWGPGADGLGGAPAYAPPPPGGALPEGSAVPPTALYADSLGRVALGDRDRSLLCDPSGQPLRTVPGFAAGFDAADRLYTAGDRLRCFTAMGKQLWEADPPGDILGHFDLTLATGPDATAQTISGWCLVLPGGGAVACFHFPPGMVTAAQGGQGGGGQAGAPALKYDADGGLTAFASYDADGRLLGCGSGPVPAGFVFAADGTLLGAPSPAAGGATLTRRFRIDGLEFKLVGGIVSAGQTITGAFPGDRFLFLGPATPRGEQPFLLYDAANGAAWSFALPAERPAVATDGAGHLYTMWPTATHLIIEKYRLP